MSKLVTVPFDLSKAKAIQNGELNGKIVTRDGRSVRIVCFDRKCDYPIIALIETGLIESSEIYYSDGKTNSDLRDTELDLFIQIPEYLTFKDGDVLKGDKLIFVLNAYGDYKTSIYAGIFLSSGNITYGGAASMNHIEEFTLATESEKQRLIEALQESTDPRAVDCLKKLGIEVKPKCEFKPFDKVLTRDYENQRWSADFFSHKEEKYYMCIGCSWNECIPYEGNEHLLGTTKNI